MLYDISNCERSAFAIQKSHIYSNFVKYAQLCPRADIIQRGLFAVI
jgi:hypothetical protein